MTMRFSLFCHSVVSDWNHGNAHFLRGVGRALQARGHEITFHEPLDGWSRAQLLAHEGAAALAGLVAATADLQSRRYRPESIDLEAVFADNDVVIVHEWTPPELVRRLGECRRAFPRVRLLFHDTHHRAVTAPAEMAQYELGDYDGVLAFGQALARIYRQRPRTPRTFVWHEAADVTCFRPLPDREVAEPIVWVGNWGDDERAEELREYLIAPIQQLGVPACVYGVRWPEAAQQELAAAGIRYRGWLPNHRVPEVFARHRVTVHVPRRPYAAALPGIPTIRPFEALACGIPLVSAPWDDCESLFAAGRDHLLVADGDGMRRALAAVLEQPGLWRQLRDCGLATIGARHTCAHRADELLQILAALHAGRGQLKETGS